MRSLLNSHFPQQASLARLGPAQRRLIAAMRQVVLHGKARSCPMPTIAPILGGPGQGKAFLKIMFVMGNIWPESVRVLHPCSKSLTYDEGLLIEMIDRAVHRDIPGFDALLCDMLGRDDRSKLFGAVLAFSSAYIGPAPRHAV